MTKCSPQKDYAALLVAQADLGTQEIAQRVGISRNTLSNWKKDPEFIETVKQNIEQIKEKFAKEHEARTNWKCGIRGKLTNTVTSLTAQEIDSLRKNPVTAINLLIRLENGDSTVEKRQERFADPYDENECPIADDISPEAQARVMAIWEQIRED